MQITKNTVVTLKYRVEDTEGNEIDEGAKPLLYLHGGYDGIFPTIENMLEGKSAGDALEVTLEPEDAFGTYDANLVMVDARDKFPEDIEIGMQLQRASDDGEEEDGFFTITDISDEKVVVDGNHPLAGIALKFNCSVNSVRAATQDEVSQGRVQIPDGNIH